MKRVLLVHFIKQTGISQTFEDRITTLYNMHQYARFPTREKSNCQGHF